MLSSALRNRTTWAVTKIHHGGGGSTEVLEVRDELWSPGVGYSR